MTTLYNYEYFGNCFYKLRLRQEADIRRTTLEEEHLSLGTRRVVASQNLSASQNAHDSLARQLADNETYVQLNNMEKKVSIDYKFIRNSLHV